MAAIQARVARSKTEPSDAAGSLPRAMVLVRAIARAGRSGATISALAAWTGLPRPTVHRVIEVLENQGWVERDQRSKAFFLGRELMCLGYAAAQRHPIERIAEPHLARLAQETRQTIYLSVRSGFDAVCMARQEGGSPVQTVAQYVGARLPLGHGAGSLAFLAALPPEDAEEVITHNLSRYRKLNPAVEEAAFRRALDRARALGYARHHGLHVRGLSGIGIALGGDAPVAAISSAFVTDWLSEADQQCLANAMQDTARALARALGLTQERKEIERA